MGDENDPMEGEYEGMEGVQDEMFEEGEQLPEQEVPNEVVAEEPDANIPGMPADIDETPMEGIHPDVS